MTTYDPKQTNDPRELTSRMHIYLSKAPRVMQFEQIA